mgnify:CR=1 FL=1
MPAQDTKQIKEKIISFLKIRGPSLPVHIAKEIQMSMLFASAFLSELLSEKKLKLSNMRVGSSPLYLIQGQESRLENFSNFLNSKEKEAFALLKEKKFLKDSEQEPAIRVALRSIRDFAIPFKNQEEIHWRFFTIPEEEFKIENKILQPQTLIQEIETTSQTIIPEKEITKISQEISERSEPISKKEDLEIFDKPHKKTEKKKSKKPQKSKKDDKFFEKVKESLQKNSIEILGIEGFNKNELILKIKENNEEKTLLAFNKKKINETDIIKAFRKIPKDTKYSILSLGEPMKKISDLLESLKNLSEIKKME